MLEHRSLDLIYDGNYIKNERKLNMRWLGRFHITYLTKVGVIKMMKSNVHPIKVLVNGSHLKPFYGHQGV